MQVMNGGDFDQKNVLVGQSGKTESFGVTNDPILMGILSTGLYANPMRTMIQEVMFNAWDAHRMGKCLDKPIDIYINDTSGLIFRDYGPGIAPEMMIPTYCIYGNSTKRDDEEATGGFGLGSKSPYAYTDSFTVTSHHNNFKSMYVMNRVSEENNGAPGMSPIIQNVPTEESGLMVTIPLKTSSDMNRAYNYILELLPMSGIKANIHYEDEMETIVTETIPAGQWKVCEKNSGSIWAVYGGVCYRIPRDDGYNEVYDFVHRMSQYLGSMYIGFKPSSLTPLPSREGLNMNERTVENIRNQLEVIEESINTMLTPAIRVVLKESFKSLKKSGIEPKFLVQYWHKVGERLRLSQVTDFDNHPILDDAFNLKPDDISESMWSSLCSLVYKRTDKAEKLIGYQKFLGMKYIIWAKNFPQHTHYKSFLMPPQHGKRSSYETIDDIETPISAAELITAKSIVDKATKRDNDIRIQYGDTWVKASNFRRAGKVPTDQLSYDKQLIIRSLNKDNLKLPNKKYPDRLWLVKDGTEFKDVYASNTVILAKTLSALKNTHWKWQSFFSTNYSNVGNYHNFHRSNFGSKRYNSVFTLAGALVVHQANGAYDDALQALKDAGYTVFEADEPEKKTRTVNKLPDGTIVPTTKKVSTYPILNTRKNDWASVEEVENPTCYLTITENKARNGYYHEKPSMSLLEYVQKRTPRMVILHSKVREAPLIKKGIPNFETKLHELVEKILQNEERVLKMVLYSEFKENSSLPDVIRGLPEVQKFFKIPYVRTSQLQNFTEDFNLLTEIYNGYRSQHYMDATKLLVNDKMDQMRKDPSLLLVRQISKKCAMFDTRQMKYFLDGKKPGEVKVFSEKLLRFLRTV